MKFFTLLVIALMSPIVLAQADSTNYKASMDGWEVDLNAAMAESHKTGKPILANFTGTDWCGWCIRLKASVFKTDTFVNWAEKNVVLLELDFPKRFALPAKIAQQNAGLAQAFGVSGYPTIWVFDISTSDKGQAKIQALAKTGYGPDAEAWINDLETKIEATRSALEKQEESTENDEDDSVRE